MNNLECMKGKKRPVEIGQSFGRGSVIDPDAGRSKGYVLVRLLCQCGQEYVATASNLWKGNTSSCGCLFKDLVNQCGPDKSGWKGDDASYKSKHQRFPKATSCVFECEHSRYENAHNLDGLSADYSDYIQLCAKCHKRYDAAIRMMQPDRQFNQWRPYASHRFKRGRDG